MHKLLLNVHLKTHDPTIEHLTRNSFNFLIRQFEEENPGYKFAVVGKSVKIVCWPDEGESESFSGYAIRQTANLLFSPFLLCWKLVRFLIIDQLPGAKR